MANATIASSFTYRLFGITLASNIPFKNHLQPARTEKPDLIFTCEHSFPLFSGWQEKNLVYPNARQVNRPADTFQLFTLDGYDVIRYPGAFDFYLRPDQIICHILNTAYLPSLEICFLGTVLSFWLERQDIPVVHASAVVVGHQAAAFLGGNGGGKSSLAAALMQLGYPLLTDDLLAIKQSGENFMAQPGYPQLRFWPQQAQHFLGSAEGLEPIHPVISKRRVPLASTGLGQFQDSPQPLSCVYLLDRYPVNSGRKKVEIAAIPARDALIELLRYSFVAPLAEAAGLQPRRLNLFAQLVRKVPVRRLSYPSNLTDLPTVCAAIAENLPQISP